MVNRQVEKDEVNCLFLICNGSSAAQVFAVELPLCGRKPGTNPLEVPDVDCSLPAWSWLLSEEHSTGGTAKVVARGFSAEIAEDAALFAVSFDAHATVSPEAVVELPDGY